MIEKMRSMLRKNIFWSFGFLPSFCVHRFFDVLLTIDLASPLVCFVMAPFHLIKTQCQDEFRILSPGWRSDNFQAQSTFWGFLLSCKLCTGNLSIVYSFLVYKILVHALQIHRQYWVTCSSPQVEVVIFDSVHNTHTTTTISATPTFYTLLCTI